MKIGTIVFVLILIFANVIAPLLKKREEQARKKRQQQGADPAAESRPRSPGGRPHTTGTGPTRMEQLIARRQAQLEELRGRREQRRAGQSPQVRIGPAPTPTPRPSPSPTVFRAPPPQPSPQPSRRVIRPAVGRQAPPKPAQRPTPVASPAAQPRKRQGLAPLASGLAATSGPTARPARKRGLRADFANITPQLLRRLVVLKEILDPPIALRNNDIWDKTC